MKTRDLIHKMEEVLGTMYTQKWLERMQASEEGRTDFIEDLVNDASHEMIMIRYFNFTDTKEGHAYWWQMAEEFEEKIKR